jgi:uncharacterized protein (DUF58 family)
MLRRLQLLLVGVVLLVAALTTGSQVLYFLLYLGALVIAGAWALTRLGLAGLEAGFALDRPQAQVGDTVQATYTLRNRSRVPKLWLEIHSPSSLPRPIPGRALALRGRTTRSWTVPIALVRRGHFRVDPMAIRTGDPFGLFTASASVGSGTALVVYPHVDPLPAWAVPPAFIEGTDAHAERTFQSTPLVTGVRPYVPGDAFNRIHWKTSARHGELQVKESDVEQTADLWLFLDLERSAHAGVDETATIETAVRACASLAARVTSSNRSVGFEAAGTRRLILPPDRGSRQHQKLLYLLAAVHPDGSVPLAEVLVDGLARLRRGMTALVVTPSLERTWVPQLARLRRRGIGCSVCIVDPVAHEEASRAALAEPPLDPDERATWERDLRALRHALAEHDLTSHVLAPGRPLGDLIVTPAQRTGVLVR